MIPDDGSELWTIRGRELDNYPTRSPLRTWRTSRAYKSISCVQEILRILCVTWYSFGTANSEATISECVIVNRTTLHTSSLWSSISLRGIDILSA